MKDHYFPFLRDSERCTHQLRTGRLTLTTHRAPDQELFRVAERQNPKRAFLFVSTVLGRHIPVAPRVHRAALKELADMALPHLLGGPVFVMGYAETAVGIGAGVFDELRCHLPERKIGYAHTTRHAIPGREPWFTIVEGHSHATDHLIYRPDGEILEPGSDSTLVLVDDETTTGKTFAELASGLFASGATFGRIILVTFTDWSDGRAVETIAAMTGADVVSVSLMEGAWSWDQDPDADLPSLPCAGTAACPAWTPSEDSVVVSPRAGARADQMTLDAPFGEAVRLPAFAAGSRILVVGTGENVWQPFLVAERLEAAGYETSFIASTRSPILPGPVIQHKITFPDHFGLGLDMYLHNVDPDAWDDILLFVETDISGIHPSLARALGKGHVIDRSGALHSIQSLFEE